MKTQRRWMKWVLEEAAKPQPPMPWKQAGRKAKVKAALLDQKTRTSPQKPRLALA